MNILHKFIVKKLTIYFIMGELSETSWYFPTCNIFPVHGQKQPGTKTPPLKIKMDYCNTFIFRWFCPRGYCVSTMCLRFVYCVSTMCLLCVYCVSLVYTLGWQADIGHFWKVSNFFLIFWKFTCMCSSWTDKC